MQGVSDQNSVNKFEISYSDLKKDFLEDGIPSLRASRNTLQPIPDDKNELFKK